MRAIEWDGKTFKLLDQTLLPHQTVYITTDDYNVIIDAIKRLCVRGAPAIGIAAAFGFAFASRRLVSESHNQFIAKLTMVAGEFKSARPTAVNLQWAVDRLLKLAIDSGVHIERIPELLLLEAETILREDIEMCKRIGKLGAELLPDEGGVLTHCNTGALATGDYGTAQSVILTALESGKKFHVYVDETRPLLQGARLTMYELIRRGVDATLITDNTAAWLMRSGKVHAVITGADRIAANGDTANKIGTYGLAVLARHHTIPFYVAAPTSTIDLMCTSGTEIPIEERDPREITESFGMKIAPEGTKAYAPAFDVTPNEFITAIVTEQGVHVPPYRESLGKHSKNRKV